LIQNAIVTAIQIAEKKVCASIVSGMDASPVLEFCEHVLNSVALSIERLVMLDWQFSVLSWRNAR
jgi:hypothetical protein